jgi:hypothetical protein
MTWRLAIPKGNDDQYFNLVDVYALTTAPQRA